MVHCVETELLSIEGILLYIAGIGIFNVFAPVTLTLTGWPSYTNLTRIPWRYTGWAFESYRLTNTHVHTDRHTDRETRPK